MPKLFKEPLVQFLIGGLLLFAALATFGGAEEEESPYVIPLNDEALLLYLQYQDKAFDTANAQMQLSELSPEQKKRLAEEYIRDEVMVREAIALGLDNNDEVIRRRLIQKMDFIVQGFAPVEQTFEPTVIEAYFDTNKDTYLIQAEATFTHVFFSKEKRGDAKALSDAKDVLSELNAQQVPFEKAAEYGDRFYFLRNYVAKPERLIRDHFGSETTKEIFSISPSSTWHGPFISEYGAHLLLLKDRKDARTPELKEVVSLVLEDLRRQARDKARSERIAELAKKYTVDRGDQ